MLCMSQVQLATPIVNPPYMSLNTPATPALEAPETSALVYGWGSTEDSDGSMSSVLKGVAVPVVCHMLWASICLLYILVLVCKSISHVEFRKLNNRNCLYE
jgi:hypothetical protein